MLKTIGPKKKEKIDTTSGLTVVGSKATTSRSLSRQRIARTKFSMRNWTMERLPRVSLTVLRLAIAEMLFGGENKPGVAINEAVELTKKYGADEDYQFVNGLLGAVARDHGLDADAAAEQAEQ